MKKGFIILGFSLFMLFQLVAFPGGSALAQRDLPQAVYVATGPPGGYQYLTITYLGNLMKSKYGMVMTPLPGGSELNIRRVIKKEVAFGNVVNQSGHDAYRGKLPAISREEAQNNLRLVASTDDSPFLFCVRGSGINNVGDLKGKGLVGQYSAFAYNYEIVKIVLENYGVLGSVKMIKGTTAADGYTGVKDRLADGFFTPLPVPHHFWEELCKDYDAKLFGIDRKEVRAKITEALPATVEIVVPKGSFTGQKEDLSTIAVTNNWLTNKDTPDRVIEVYLDELFNPKNSEQLIKIHPVLKQYTLKRAVLNPQVPFHEAAIRYYKKVGIWTAELEKKQQSLLKLGGQVK